jgi:hypothetical protein
MRPGALPAVPGELPMMKESPMLAHLIDEVLCFLRWVI